MPAGRPPRTLCGLRDVQWATALGEPTATSLRRARAVLSGMIEPGPLELARVADATGVDLAELTRALAALRGYLAPDTPAGDPHGAALVDGD